MGKRERLDLKNRKENSMTQEEKAKAYDEAIRKAKITLGCCDSASIITEHTICDIFPELAENEDEKVRKALLNYLTKMWGNSQDDICGVHVEDAIAWLEKQGNTPYSGVTFEYDGHTWGMCARDGGVDILLDSKLIKHIKKQGEQEPPKWSYEDERAIGIITYALTHPYDMEGKYDRQFALDWLKSFKSQKQWKTTEESLGIDSETYNEIVDECIYGKQEPTDKIKSKFNVGDWITFYGGKPFKVLRIEAENNGILEYLLLNQSGHDSFYNKKYVDENARLWTIQDAKDGDVLVDEDNNIGIYEEIEGLCWHSYIYLGCDGRLYGFSIGGSHEKNNTKPATKEQRDLLFQKIKEAEYIWNSEKKELKKIEQEPQRIVSAEVKEVDKSARSEEDTVTVKLQRIIDFLWHNRKGDTDAIFQQEQDIAWLKSLKQRLGGEK